MITTTRRQRSYDHRLRELVRSTGDIKHAIQRGVPRSTARRWLSSNLNEVISVDVLDLETRALQQELLILRRRVERLTTLVRLLVVLVKVSDFFLHGTRIPDGDRKRVLLRTIERARTVLALRVVLRVLRLSHSRYHSWRREQECGLDDLPSCPRSIPHQLTFAEIGAIRDMVTSDEYRHVPTGTLAVLAQRLGKVFVSASTWYRLVQFHQWRRPRQRVHPAKPKVGIRASQPNEIWHVDTTLIRLLDGSRAYVHAIIDHFSRRILAWKVSGTFNPATTAELLLKASKTVESGTPTLLADGGAENVNSAVNDLIDSGVLKRLLARTEITYSNSMIESWWRQIKHQWLYLNDLDTVSSLKKLVAFYVEQHNGHLPHAAFRGQTPNEMYFGTGTHIPKQLESSRQAARKARMEANRKRSCQICEPEQTTAD